MKNVIDTTIRRMDDALAIEGRDEFQVYDEGTGTYEWDERLFLFKPVVKPVSGKSLAWMLAHGGREWLESHGFSPAVLDAPTFNPKRKYIICVDADGFYTFHPYKDYLSWKY